MPQNTHPYIKCAVERKSKEKHGYGRREEVGKANTELFFPLPA